MDFSVGTNWQDDLIAKIKSKEVKVFYAKLANDFVGGGRASHILPHVNIGHIKRHIHQVHLKSMEFNYLLNSVCLGNREFTIRGQKKLRQLLDLLVYLTVDRVTVANPYLFQFIRKNYPQFKIEVSSLAGVDGIEKAKYWEKLGASLITLSSHKVNRNFRLLKSIRKNVKCKLQLILNNFCLLDCPYYNYHGCLGAHSSQAGHFLRGFVIDYYFLNCRYKMLSDPSEAIRSNWIRPEDIYYYENIGIDSMKIVQRSASTANILLRIEAYSSRRYEGNLLDLLNNASLNRGSLKNKMFCILKYYLRPSLINIFKLYKIRNLMPVLNLYINNQKLDGFLEYFLKNDCSAISCGGCNYCQTIARKTVAIDENIKETTLNKYEDILDSIISGDMFRY